MPIIEDIASMKRFLSGMLLLPTLAGPAAAHPGDHTRMPLTELISHYAEADHLAFLALTVIVGWLAYRAGRRAEARVRIERDDREKRP
jgi:hypothetical protein